MKKRAPNSLVLILFLAFTACANRPVNSADANSIHSDTTISRNNSVQRVEQTKMYTQAIAEYIRAVYKNDSKKFDTLFFGKHVYGQPDDFPDIDLPETLEQTQIRLVAPELGLKLQQERKSLVFINMMGWVDSLHAEFILVTFSNGGEHKFDCYINYKRNSKQEEFDVEKLRLEYFSKEGKIERKVNYLNGQLVEEKSQRE